MILFTANHHLPLTTHVCSIISEHYKINNTNHQVRFNYFLPESIGSKLFTHMIILFIGLVLRYANLVHLLKIFVMFEPLHSYTDQNSSNKKISPNKFTGFRSLATKILGFLSLSPPLAAEIKLEIFSRPSPFFSLLTIQQALHFYFIFFNFYFNFVLLMKIMNFNSSH